jgi:hypothetical protein
LNIWWWPVAVLVAAVLVLVLAGAALEVIGLLLGIW